MSSPVVSSRTPNGQIINRDGTATFAFIKWMQGIGTTINNSFTAEGSYQGDIGDQATIAGRETLASIVQYISNDGVVQGPGIDFALPYLNKDTDHIADGTGSPLAGGREAYTALVASGPVAGQTLRFNGTDWLPVAIAVSKVLVVSQWLRSYDAATGTFTASQPAFSDVSGVATKAQLPASIAYEDESNTFTANQTINGDLAVTGNISAANFPGSGSMVYPGIGIGVSTGSAWGPSIDPATVPRLNTTNTFTAAQTINGNLTVSGTTTTANGHIRLIDRASFVTGGAPSLNADATNILINSAAAGSVVFNYDQGSGSKFGNGAGSVVASIDASGTGTFNGNLSTTGSGAAGVTANSGGLVTSFNVSNSLGEVDFVGSRGGLSGGFRWYNLPAGFTVTSANSPSMALDASDILHTAGGFATSGVKAFRIPHPLDDTKDLLHACLEGPENGVYYRGRAKTADDGYVTIFLPDYFEALTHLEDRTVQLTVINDGLDTFPILKSSEVSAGGFQVRSSIPETEFYWEVKAVRKVGVDRLQVVRDKRDD